MRIYRLKSVLFLVVFLKLTLSTFAQKVAIDAKEGEVIVKGKIGTIHAPKQLWIYMGNTSEWDSIPIQEGRFEYKKRTKLPAYGALMLKYKPYYKGKKGYTNFFGDMDLKSLYFEAGLMEVNSLVDSLKKTAVVRGSKIHKQEEDYLRERSFVLKEQQKLAADFNLASPEQISSEHFLQDYEQRSEAIEKKLEAVLAAQIKRYPTSLVSQIAFLEYLRINEGTLNPVSAKKMFALFSLPFKESETGKNALKSIENSGKSKSEVKVIAVGDLSPAFAQASSSGKVIQLKDFLGKYVLLDFWASWCEPCRRVNPELVSTFHRFRGKHFTILGISLDNDRSKWEKAILDDKLDWPQVSDLKGWNNAVAKQYGIQGIPQNVLIDPQGKIVAKNIPIKALSSTLFELGIKP